MAGALTNRGRGNGKTVGGLRHRVTIQVLDESTRDDSRAVVPTWLDVATVWASVDPVGGREMFASGQVQANTTYRVCMRHREDVTPKNRLIWVTSKPANKVLNLTAALLTVGTGNSLELVCVEEIQRV